VRLFLLCQSLLKMLVATWLQQIPLCSHLHYFYQHVNN